MLRDANTYNRPMSAYISNSKQQNPKSAFSKADPDFMFLDDDDC